MSDSFFRRPISLRRTIFLVQEYMHGGTIKSQILNQMINRSKMVYSYSQGLRWCLGAASALAAMHASEPMVIHRDLKCDNILLTKTGDGGVAKVADLGLHALVEKKGNSGKKGDKLKLDPDSPDSPPPLKQTKPYQKVQTRKLAVHSNGQAAMEAENAPTFWKMTGQTGGKLQLALLCPFFESFKPTMCNLFTS